LAAATKGMLSDAEQIQMGTDLMSLGLAKTSDQVVRLSKASAGLGMDMNQLVLTLANQTTMRFDQLGVSIDGFDARLAKLKASGMDANSAFTEAFLQQAEEQMKKLGDASETTAGKMKRAESAINNLLNGMKQIAAEGVGTALDMVEAPKKMAEAFSATAQQMQADLISGKMTLEDYNNGLRGMAESMAGPLGVNQAIANAAYNTYALTAAQQQNLIAINQVDYASRMAAESSRASAAAEAARVQSMAQAQAAAETHTTVMRNYSNELLYNVQQYQAQQAAAEAAAAAEATHRASIAESITANVSLAQSLKTATDAQATQMLAQAQLDVINTAYKEGTITQDEYNLAIDRVLLKYDLATPKSMAMADAQNLLNQAFADGNIGLLDYVNATEQIPQIAEDGKVTLQELAEVGVKPTTAAVGEQQTAVSGLTAAWASVPTTVKTTYIIETKGEMPEGAGGGTHKVPSRQGGGPTGPGGMFLLHPNEWVLSEAQRYGREPIPPEAIKSISGAGGKQIVNQYQNNFYDSLATRMYLEDLRLRGLQDVAANM